MRGHTLALQLSTMMKQFVPLGKAAGVAMEVRRRQRRETGVEGEKMRGKKAKRQKGTRIASEEEGKGEKDGYSVS